MGLRQKFIKSLLGLLCLWTPAAPVSSYSSFSTTQLDNFNIGDRHDTQPTHSRLVSSSETPLDIEVPVRPRGSFLVYGYDWLDHDCNGLRHQTQVLKCALADAITSDRHFVLPTHICVLTKHAVLEPGNVSKRPRSYIQIPFHRVFDVAQLMKDYGAIPLDPQRHLAPDVVIYGARSTADLQDVAPDPHVSVRRAFVCNDTTLEDCSNRRHSPKVLAYGPCHGATPLARVKTSLDVSLSPKIRRLAREFHDNYGPLAIVHIRRGDRLWRRDGKVCSQLAYATSPNTVAGAIQKHIPKNIRVVVKTDEADPDYRRRLKEAVGDRLDYISDLLPQMPNNFLLYCVEEQISHMADAGIATFREPFHDWPTLLPHTRRSLSCIFKYPQDL